MTVTSDEAKEAAEHLHWFKQQGVRALEAGDVLRACRIGVAVQQLEKLFTCTPEPSAQADTPG